MVGLTDHAPAAAPADQQTGKQVHLIGLGGGSCIDAPEPLHKVKILLFNDGFMGAFHPHPLVGGLAFPLLQFKMRRALPPLYQRASIGFVPQDAYNGSSRPLAILLVRKAVFSMGQAGVLLIRQRRQDAHAVQLRRDVRRTDALHAFSEYVPYHIRCVVVDFQFLMLVARFEIAVYGKRAHKVTTAPLYVRGAAGFDGNILAVRLVHSVFYRYGQFVARISCRVHIVVNGNEAHAIGGEYPAYIAPGFYISKAQAR